MLEKLKNIVSTTNSRVIGQVVNSKANYPLGDWIKSQTAFLPETASIKERIHILLSGDRPVCKHGKIRKFYSLSAGGEYKFCNDVSKCQCHREHYDIHHKPLDPSTIKYICEKRKETWLAKYGVDNPSKNIDIANKRRITISKKSYTEIRKKLRLTLQDIGYNNVINRVKDYVTPAFNKDEYKGCFRKNFYKWQCNTCGQIFIDHVDYGRIPRCLNCKPHIISSGEKELREYIISLGFNPIINCRDILNGKELDIYIPEKNLAIEFNGIYWHSSKHKDRYYHVDKFIQCRDIGIKLVQIFEDEWIRSPEIVKARLQAMLGKGSKLFARKCEVKIINQKDYKTFCKLFHLQGYSAALIRYGLYYNDSLVAVMGLGKSRYTDEGYELIRYCSNGTVVGGASKLFSCFIKDHNPTKIVSYANRCWSDGGLYKKLGFCDVTIDDRNTGYWYIKQNIRYHRSTFTKARLIKLGYDKSLTEQKIMESCGYFTIFDCGNYKFEWSSK